MDMHAQRYEEPLAPAWDVGRPQRALYELEVAGAIGREVIDVGCGAGEHALWLAARGHVAWGLDPSAGAIARAMKRARREGLTATFVVDELVAGVGRLARTFDCAIDAGTFHRVAVGERRAYARALASVVRPGGKAYVLCFADREKGRGGPARVTRAELEGAFAAGDEWRVEAIEPSVIESRLFPGGAAAWLLRAVRK